MRTIEEIKEVLEVEKQTYSDGGETDDIILGWIEALEYVLGGSETKEVPEDEIIIRSWSDDDQYVLDTKKALNTLEYSISKHNGVSGISGGYCTIDIIDRSTDVFDYNTEEEIDNFHLAITFGVKSDCDDWSTTYYRRMNCGTLEIISEEEK